MVRKNKSKYQGDNLIVFYVAKFPCQLFICLYLKNKERKLFDIYRIL